MILTRFISALLLMLVFTTANAIPEEIHDFPPFRIADNLYFIGNDFDASYLVVTPKGNIIINSGFQDRLPKLKASIEKLGFKFADTKIVLLSHGHIDHAGASELIKEQTGAKLMVMSQDVPILESGGKKDFVYGNDPKLLFPAAKVDKSLHDGDQVKLGNVILTAHLTPGHTPGCTTWAMKVTDHHHPYNVVIFGSTSVNPGYQLINNKVYPNIVSDYEHTFKVLKSLPCDIFLGSHGGFFNIEDKYQKLSTAKTNPFIDPDAYKKFVAAKEVDFKQELIKQSAAAKTTRS